MKLDLETLKQVKFTFELHSDHSTNCNGYRRLCEMIIEAEKEALQQTAVEWLYNHLFPTKLDASTEEEWNKIDAVFEQAKAMEKEQIIEAYKYGNQSDVYFKPEQYYNEIYGK
jgi:hypothetical protein